jgi:hypothetical protein
LQGGIDFNGCQTDPKTGFCCVEKDEEVTTLQKDPVLECTHKNVEKCHYTYVTQFDSAQVEQGTILYNPFGRNLYIKPILGKFKFVIMTLHGFKCCF